MNTDQIAQRVARIRLIYLGLACLVTIGLLHPLVKYLWIMFRIDARTLPAVCSFLFPEAPVGDLLFSLLYWSAYLGLKRQRNWVLPLLLITSIFSLLQIIPAIIEPAMNSSAFISKAILFFFLFFYWYQAFFFSRREVRRHFDSNGTLLF